MKIYRGQYVDIETDLNNENIQVVHRLDILDQNTNPYNVALSEEVAGSDTIYTFTFDDLPATATGTVIEYTSDGGLNWFAVPGGTTSPQSITLPTLAYFFSFRIIIPGGNIYWSNEDEIVELEMTDQPVKDIVIDNDEDKFTVVRSRQLEIQFYSNNNVSINKFSKGGDNSFKVNYYIDGVLDFTGFLSLGDLSQEFMPNPNIISLVAVDGLGFLKDIPLTDYDGDTPTNEQSLLNFLLWCLYKTSHRLDLAVVFNIREITAPTLNADSTGVGHIFKYCFIDSKTFETEVGECEDCFTAIEKIIGPFAFLCQRQGEWRITRVDEISSGVNTAVQTVYRWAYDGTFVNKTAETHEKSVGVGESYSWMNDDAIVALDRLIKESRLIYRFELPKEIPCNIDFSRGTLLSDTPTLKVYSLDCWTPLFKDGTGDHASAATIHLYVEYVDGYETNRYIVFFDNGVFNFLLSEGIPVHAGDKAEISVNRRMQTNHATGGTDNAVQLRLYGDDGTFWTHHGRNSSASPDASLAYWVACDSLFQTNQKFHGFEMPDDFDDRDSISLYDGEVGPIPVSGTIKMLIYTSALWGGSEDTYIESASFDLRSYINGAFDKYTAQQWTVAQTADTKNVREQEVFVSDSPKKIFKGALKIYNGSAFVLAGLFYNAVTEPDGPLFPKKYGEIQAFDVWNQFNRTMVKFDGTVDHSSPAPDLISKYFMTDSNENTSGRIFLLLHYELDTHLCEWQAFFIEVDNENIARIYLGGSFKYISK